MMWVVEVNRSAITDEDRNINAPQIYVADKRTAEWEDDYIDFFLSYTGLQGYRMYFYSMRSFLIVTVETILDDLGMLIVGYVLVFVFVVLILGRRSCVESRVYLEQTLKCSRTLWGQKENEKMGDVKMKTQEWILSALGMASVAFSTLTAIGLCHRMGFVYGSMHRAMPFVLLGIGIDDMFVIIQAFENLPKKELSGKSLRTRVGLTMEHAGVAITITSVTDFAAFVIGATTIIPALRSFCVYTAVGILVLYIFQSCFFVACFTLDQRRMESGRNGFLFCFKQPDGCGPRMECAKYDLIMIFFRDFYSPVLLKPLGKILVSLFTLGFLAWSIYGFYHLEQMFDRIWMLPESSYLHQYFKHSKIYYPSHWEMGALLVGSVDYPEELGNIHRVVTELRSEPTMRHVNSWTNDFIPYVNTYWNASAPDVPLPEDQFHSLLSLFLFSPKGGKYTHQFEFNGTLDCLSPAPPIIASRIDFEYKPMSGPHEHIPAMRRVKTAVLNSQITTGDQFVLSWARAYGNWEIDEIIQEELYRNIGLAMVCVFVVTLGLLGNIWTCLIVLSCVVMTLISVAGLMYNWGVTIDTVSCICMVLAIGLSVDYSAHVGHTFMTVSGTRDRRAALTLTRIGPAVFSGGFSTFLAFAALFTSQSHVFKTFFKIFFGVVIFGLYYALCFLPVFLSWFGPAPYQAGLREDYGEEMEDRGGMSCKENLEAGVVLIEARNGSLDGDLSKKTGARDPIKSSAEMTGAFA
ncbi:unnamed protein product [Cyprideis torosa]|uniref:Uncharacterized protein n=1 Tax=Cyprideis torosa TaxID=163714 RepID=A0A7R8W9Z7_9CRUS|nr:unnamed protein product [Cyprideis torosa]CAG0890355.1 unnamed protein product [Cyprideis torosa]